MQRRLLVLEEQGADKFFGEPALNIMDLMRTTRDGRGYINVLASDKLMQSPQLYAVFLFWLLSELYTQMPEVGDLDKPKLVFFFDEAHLLFDQAPKALLDKVEQVTRLIRSKGVGVYYITQNPLDVPDIVAGQLGNRVQHALRAFTPREQKAVKAAATTFRQNPGIDTEKVIMELGVGEALVSMLEGKGTPAMVARTLIRPPSGRLGPVTPDERSTVIKQSPVFGQYEKTIDRQSAYEMLNKSVARKAEQQGQPIGNRRAKNDLEQHGEFQVPSLPGEGDRAARASLAPLYRPANARRRCRGGNRRRKPSRSRCCARSAPPSARRSAASCAGGDRVGQLGHDGSGQSHFQRERQHRADERIGQMNS